MEKDWLRQSSENQDVIIFLLGWAATPNAVLHIAPPGYDVLACHNHSGKPEPFRAEDFARYRRIFLFAWSFGVWVAEQCCRELPLYRAVALNGTPYPVDPRWGMRLKVVLRSMQTIARSGGENAFAATGAAAEGRYIPDGPYPDRSADEKVNELINLSDQAKDYSAAHLTWHRAYIADKDEIFPPARMWDYWSTVGLGTEFDSYHYPFTDAGIVLNELI
ncbi:MAG: DUF452 family protein [Akkermansia sp.]|nr:DUF452 family protein [Akkermansia sp.]